eukprot:5468337-Pyramimonas_sp.AAC.1
MIAIRQAPYVVSSGVNECLVRTLGSKVNWSSSMCWVRGLSAFVASVQTVAREFSQRISAANEHTRGEGTLLPRTEQIQTIARELSARVWLVFR